MGLLEGVGGIWPPFLTSKKISRIGPQLRPMSNSSHGAKQEDVVKKQRVRSEQNSTFGCRAGKIPGKKQHFGMQRGQNP